MTARLPGLRRAGPADFPAIAALEAACFSPEDGGFSPRQLRALLANPNAYWLLSGDGRAVACWLKARNRHRAWARLYSLAVHPHARGQGWAGRLLDAGFAWMMREGLSTCRAEVKADNKTARNLYARYGFEEIAILPGYYGTACDGIRLAKRLPFVASPATGRTALKPEVTASP